MGSRLSFGRIDAKWMAVARGDEPADLVLAGGRVFSVFTKEWLDVDVAVTDGHVVGLGSYPKALERFDARGAHLVPGFIDAHMHIESSKLCGYSSNAKASTRVVCPASQPT